MVESKLKKPVFALSLCYLKRQSKLLENTQTKIYDFEVVTFSHIAYGKCILRLLSFRNWKSCLFETEYKIYFI